MDFFIDYFRSTCVSYVEAFARCLTEKLLPAFNNAEEEAKQIEEAEYQRLNDLPGNGEVAPDEIAETAFEKGLFWYTSMVQMRQALINMFAVGLYHLFEQQLKFSFSRDLEELGKKKSLEKVLEDNGFETKNFQSWPKINELRLIANTAKHAEGKSSKDLKTICPELFEKPLPEDDDCPLDPGPVYRPLFGEQFYVTKETFEKYVEALKCFWIELSNQAPETHPKQ